MKLLGTRNVGETTCVVDNQDLKLLPNINVGVTIVTAEHQNALTVPREAVRLDDGKTFVYQIVNDELQRRDIQTSISNLTAGGNRQRSHGQGAAGAGFDQLQTVARRRGGEGGSLS